MRAPSLLLSLAIAACSLASAASASAQARVVYVRPAPPPQRVVYVRPVVREPYTHSGGFFGRFQIGPAFSYSAYSSDGDEIDLAWGGGAVNLSFSVGFSLRSPASIALHADFLGDYAWEPEVYDDGGRTWTLVDAMYATSGFGFGVTHWFVRNGFITGGLGFAVASLINDYEQYDSEVGGYLTFAGGKEWWVAPRFGIGVYGRLTAYRLPDRDFDYDASFTTVAPSAGLTMSFD